MPDNSYCEVKKDPHAEILNSTSDHLAIVGSNGVILKVNEAWMKYARENGGANEKALGVGANYFVPFDASWGDVSCAQEAFAGLRKVQRGQLPYFSLKYPCHEPGNNEQWFIMAVIPFLWKGGNVFSVLVSHIRITGKEAEWEIPGPKSDPGGATMAQGRPAVHTASPERECPDALRVQQAKIAAMRDMLAAVAHHWRQPLNILGLVVQSNGMAYEEGSLDADFIQNTQKKAMQQIAQMSMMINKFIDFYGIDAEKVPFDAMSAVAETLKLVSRQLSVCNIAFRIECHTHSRVFKDFHEPVACSASRVFGYQYEFGQAVMNLIKNAKEAIIAAREDGRRNTDEQGLIAFDFYRDQEMILIEISDNGGGIAPELLDRIFEPYFTSKDPAVFLGLGLYASKNAVEKMGGRLSAVNRDQGAVFTIEVPAVSV